jgi:ubiquitin C-terminal hydrolase
MSPVKSLVTLFESVKDFNGSRNRYHQLSATEFVDFIVLKAPQIFVGFTNITFTLTCRICQWISVKDSTEPSAKLYFPSNSPDSVSLQNLIRGFSRSVLDHNDKVFCGQCGCKTPMCVSRAFSGKVVILELMRGFLHNGTRRKNHAKVTFPLHGITLPGSNEKFRVVASCHHSGNVSSGHWYSWIMLDRGEWFEVNDLNAIHRRLSSVIMKRGAKTVCLLLLIADSMLHFASGPVLPLK